MRHRVTRLEGARARSSGSSPAWRCRLLFSRLVVSLFAVLGALDVEPQTAEAFFHDELIDGDLAGDRLAPTRLALSPYANTLAMTSGSASGSVDRDYFTFTVPSGWELSVIRVQSANTDGVAFVGMQSGSVFTEPPLPVQVGNLLGWHHFGVGEVGTDILPAIGLGAGAQGFVPPLEAGSYAFWAQDFGFFSEYVLEFEVTPVPEAESGSLLLSGVLAIASRGRPYRAVPDRSAVRTRRTPTSLDGRPGPLSSSGSPPGAASHAPRTSPSTS